MKKHMSILLAIAITLATLVVSVPASAAANNFTDISGHWAKTYINYVCNTKGVMGGVNDSPTTFGPYTNLTRAEFVMILGKVCGIKESEWKTGSKFNDVPTNSKYYPFVNWASSNGITNGTSSSTGTFSPNNPIKRQDMAVFLSRYAAKWSVPLKESVIYPSFPDQSDISAYATSAVRQIVRAGLMQGRSGSFKPQENINRAEAATTIYNLYVRYLSKEAYASKTVKVAVGMTSSFCKEYSSPSSKASSLMKNASMPFLNRWNITLSPTYSNLTGLPEDECPHWDKLCDDSCGTVCINKDDPNTHHKNIYRALRYIEKNMPYNNCAFRMSLSSSVFCRTKEDGSHSGSFLGLSNATNNAIVAKIKTTYRANERIIQHETSHIFGCPDNKCSIGTLCIMSGGFDNNNTFDLPNLWCPACTQVFDRTKY